MKENERDKNIFIEKDDHKDVAGKLMEKILTDAVKQVTDFVHFNNMPFHAVSFFGPCDALHTSCRMTWRATFNLPWKISRDICWTESAFVIEHKMVSYRPAKV